MVILKLDTFQQIEYGEKGFWSKRGKKRNKADECKISERNFCYLVKYIKESGELSSKLCKMGFIYMVN